VRVPTSGDYSPPREAVSCFDGYINLNRGVFFAKDTFEATEYRSTVRTQQDFSTLNPGYVMTS
jgi:hypothetical protein